MNDEFAGWREASYSANAGNCIEVGWRKASYSVSAGNCVEVAADEEMVGVRDTKQSQRGPVLEFGAGAWRSFIASLKA